MTLVWLLQWLFGYLTLKVLLREAWLKLSMLNHPDMNQEGGEKATQKFMEIKEAYQVTTLQCVLILTELR